MLEDARRRLGKTGASTASSHWHWALAPITKGERRARAKRQMAAPRKSLHFQIHVQAALPTTSHSQAGRPRRDVQRRARMAASRTSPRTRPSRGAMGLRHRLRATTRHEEAAPPLPRLPPELARPSLPPPSRPSLRPTSLPPPPRGSVVQRQAIDDGLERSGGLAFIASWATFRHPDRQSPRVNKRKLPA